MTKFEQMQRASANRFCLIVLLIHIPALAGVAAWFDSGILASLLVSAILLVGPAAMYLSRPDSLATSISMASATMGLSALLIHLSHGMIEMHFHIFAGIAFLIVFGSVWPILTAAVIIALHHLLFWLWLPSSVFNYKAGFGIIVVHAAFVIFETIPACWITLRLGRSIKAQGLIGEQLKQAAEQVSEAALQIESSSQTLSRACMDQAAAVEEISASGVEIGALSERASQTSKAAAECMVEVDKRIVNANQILTALTSSMSEIRSSGEKVTQIIRVINEVAFQTNILALNAAVEAARAGEAGLGFAVVADEVRNLAQRCSQAAADTESLINESVKNTLSGNTRVEEIAAAVSGITEVASKVKNLFEQMRTGGREQSSGIAQISTALHNIEGTTQQTTAIAEENAASGKLLSSQASSMIDIVKTLETLA